MRHFLRLFSWGRPGSKVKTMVWIQLIAAGLLEVVWAFTMKQSHGFTRMGYSAVTVLAMIGSVWLLARTMQVLPLGTAYVVWTGIGSVGAFALGLAILGETASPARIGAAVMIIGGIILMKLGGRTRILGMAAGQGRAGIDWFRPLFLREWKGRGR